MSNRQARKLRKTMQKAGNSVYVHLKPTVRKLAPIGYIREEKKPLESHINNREVARRAKRYGQNAESLNIDYVSNS